MCARGARRTAVRGWFFPSGWFPEIRLGSLGSQDEPFYPQSHRSSPPVYTMESFAAALDFNITAFSPSPHLGCSEHGCANTGLSPCSEPYARRLLDHTVTNCPPISTLYIFIIFKKGKCPENLGTPPPSQDTGPHYWLCFLCPAPVASASGVTCLLGKGGLAST